MIFNETNRAALPITYSTNDGQPAAIYMYNVYRVRYVHLLCPIGEEIGAGGGVELSCSHGDKDGKDVQKTRLIGTQSSGMFSRICLQNQRYLGYDQVGFKAV